MGKPIAVLALLLLLLVAAPARGDAVETIVEDCAASESGFLTGSYANGDLRAALRELRGEMAEYSGCADAIREALRVNRERETAGQGEGDGRSGGGAENGGGASGGSGPGSGFGSGGGSSTGAAGTGEMPGAEEADPAATPNASGPDGDAALAAAGSSAAGGGATPLVTRREGFALASAPGRELPRSLLTALGLLAALAAAAGGAARLARRRN